MIAMLLAAAVLAVPAKESPIVCNLNALSAAERQHHARLTAQLKAAVVDVAETADGYRLSLRPGVPAGDLFQWVEFERRCCPFLDFEIRIEREHGPVRLTLSGRPGVKELLAAELGLAKTTKGR